MNEIRNLNDSGYLMAAAIGPPRVSTPDPFSDKFQGLIAQAPTEGNSSSIDFLLKNITIDDLPQESKFDDLAKVIDHENTKSGTFEYLGPSDTHSNVGIAIASERAVQIRQKLESLFRREGFNPADFGVEVLGVKFLGRNSGVSTYAMAVNHLPGASLEQQLRDGVHFDDQEINNIRRTVWETYRKLYDSGFEVLFAEFHPGNILINRGENGQIKNINTIDLEVRDRLVEGHGLTDELEVRLYVESWLLTSFRHELLADLPPDFLEDLFLNVYEVGEALDSHLNTGGELDLLIAKLNVAGEQINMLPGTLQVPYRVMIRQTIDSAGILPTELPGLSDTTKQVLAYEMIIASGPVFTPQGQQNLEILDIDGEHVAQMSRRNQAVEYGLKTVIGRPFQNDVLMQIDTWDRQLNQITNGKVRLDTATLHTTVGTILDSFSAPLTSADLQTVNLNRIRADLGQVEPLQLSFTGMSFERNPRSGLADGNIVLTGTVNESAGLNELRQKLAGHGAISSPLRSAEPGQPAKVSITLKHLGPDEINTLTETEAQQLHRWVAANSQLQAPLVEEVDRFKLVQYSQRELLTVSATTEEILLAGSNAESAPTVSRSARLSAAQRVFSNTDHWDISEETSNISINREQLLAEHGPTLDYLHVRFGEQLTQTMINANLGLVNEEYGLRSILSLLDEVDPGGRYNLTVNDLAHLQQVIANLPGLTLHDANHIIGGGYGTDETVEVFGIQYAENLSIDIENKLNSGELRGSSAFADADQQQIFGDIRRRLIVDLQEWLSTTQQQRSEVIQDIPSLQKMLYQAADVVAVRYLMFDNGYDQVRPFAQSLASLVTDYPDAANIDLRTQFYPAVNKFRQVMQVTDKDITTRQGLLTELHSEAAPAVMNLLSQDELPTRAMGDWETAYRSSDVLQETVSLVKELYSLKKIPEDVMAYYLIQFVSDEGVAAQEPFFDRYNLKELSRQYWVDTGREQRNASLKGLVLGGAREIDLAGSDLSEGVFHEADLVRANFQGATLAAADFEDADLRQANLSFADLSGAKLLRANLNSANLQGANLTDTDMRLADLRNANLQGVKYNKQTQWQGAQLTDAQIQSLELRAEQLAPSNTAGQSPGGLDVGPDPSAPINPDAPSSRQSGTSPQAGSSGLTVSNLLKPFNNPNGLISNDGTQAGHGNNGNRGNTRTAVADDPQEPNNPFQVVNGQVVVGDKVLLPELDLSKGSLQSGGNLFGVPVGLAGLPEYTPAPRSENSLATEHNIPVADTNSESTPQTQQQQGGVTWGGLLGNDKGKTAAELGLDPSGKLPGPEKAKAPDPIPGYGEGVNTQDLNQNNTRDWGGGPVTPDQDKLTQEGFPQQDKTLEDILNPEGPSGARFKFPPGNEEIPAAEYQAVIKTLPALQQISLAEYSQLSLADQKNILSRAIEYQSLPADIKANTRLLQYADSGQTSASQRSQMLGVQQKQTVQTAQQMLSGAQSGLNDSTVQLINTRIEALQQNTAALNQQTQVLTQSNANRQSTLATPTTDPVTTAFIKPDIKPGQTPPASNSNATPQINSQASPIPRFMVIRTANGSQLMENLANGKTQMLPYPIPADTPITRQSSDGAWRNVPDAYAIGVKNLLDTLLLQSTVKMLNGGNAVQIPAAQNAAPQAPTGIPQPAF